MHGSSVISSHYFCLLIPRSSIITIHSPEASQQHESEESNGQSLLNDQTFDANSFAPTKKVCSVDVSSSLTAKPTSQNGDADAAKAAKPTGGNIKIEKDLTALKKEIMSLYGPIKDPFKLPKMDEKNDKPAFPIAPSVSAIGMDIFGNKGDTVKPSFSFSFPENNDLLAAKPAKALETGTYSKHFLNFFAKMTRYSYVQSIVSAISFSFNTNKGTDAQKPFMFQAKSLEDVSEKSTRESINPKSKLPTRAAPKRMK